MTKYPDYTISNKEFHMDDDVDLSVVFKDILEGTATERPRGTLVVLQRLVRDEHGQPIVSPYVYKETQEGREHDRGPATTRTGYLCNEELQRIFHRAASRMIMDEMTAAEGNLVPTRDVAYFVADANPKMHDIVVFIKTDEEGNPINPVTPESEVIITKVYPKRLDMGKVEYWACIVEDQK